MMQLIFYLLKGFYLVFCESVVVTTNRRQKGVVWVEFLVVSSTILISLFILIPVLAKYMDIRHKTEQSAQYVVWESSVWHNGRGKTGAKSDVRLLGEAQQRILADGDTLVYTGQENNNLKVDSLHYFVDSKSGSQNYTTLIGARGSSARNAMTIGVYSEADQPEIGKIKTAVDAVSKTAALAKIVQYGGGLEEKVMYATGVATLDGSKVMNEKGYYIVDNLSLEVKSPSWMSAFSSGADTMKMTTSKSLLVDGWGAGGRDDVKEEVNKLQPARPVMRLASKAYQYIFTNPIVSILNLSEDLDMMDYDESGNDFYINSDELLDEEQLGVGF